MAFGHEPSASDTADTMAPKTLADTVLRSGSLTGLILMPCHRRLQVVDYLQLTPEDLKLLEDDLPASLPAASQLLYGVKPRSILGKKRSNPGHGLQVTDVLAARSVCRFQS
jgi:hypothetical protein